MNIYLEIFGYIGTALVIISMMMNSMLKLRIFNMCGALISMIYAIARNTWPVAVLNFCLLAINLFQTVRELRQKKKENENPSVGMILCASKDDEIVEYAMSRTLSPMMVAEYKLQLPDKAILQKKLQELINMPLIEE